MKNFRSKIFDFKTDRRPVREGSLLVSEPFLKEHFFKHAVISLVDYGADTGAMGVVLNNRTALTLDEVLEHVRPETKVPVYCGGPLSHDRLFFIHDLGSGLIPGAREYCDGLWIGDGVTEQSILKINSLSAELYEEIGGEYGFSFTKGRMTLAKLLTSREEE